MIGDIDLSRLTRPLLRIGCILGIAAIVALPIRLSAPVDDVALQQPAPAERIAEREPAPIVPSIAM
jgi:hypothetical protein